MEAITEFLGALLRQFAVGPALLAFLLIVFIYVMTWNYRRLRRERLTPDLLEGEKGVDQLDVDFGLARWQTVLTNRRALQLRLSWFLSKRRQLAVALLDVHSVVWRRYTNWVLIAVGLYFAGTFNPLALLLVVWGLECKIYSVRFQTPFAQMPWTRVVVTTFRRKQLSEFVRFYRSAQALWARIRTEKELADSSTRIGTVAEQDTDFAWGRPIWVYIWFLLACGLMQRIVEPHLSFDDYFFSPIYLGLPVAVAQRSRRDAVWTAIFGVTALLTMKFPSSGLTGFLVGDGRSPYFEQYVLVMVTLVVMALIASAIAQYLHPSLAFLAVIVWLGFVGFHMPTVFFDYALYAKVALAMATAILLTWVERAAGRFYGTAT